MRERAPHKVSTWVRDLASAFHGFYHDCPILRSDVDETVRQARLWLVEASRIGFAVGLDLVACVETGAQPAYAVVVSDVTGDLTLRHGADDLIGDLAAVEDQQRRDAANAELLSRLLRRVDIM